MKEVMQKAQELAEAILNSEIYQDMKKQENAVQRDAEAAGLLGDLIENGSAWKMCFQAQR